MAPNKFEKHIKKQLEQREIKPSKNAWAILDEQLDTIAPPKKKGYLWYGVAASFIGILILSIVYFSSESLMNMSDVEVVDTVEKVRQLETNLDTVAVKIIEVKVVNDQVSLAIKEKELASEIKPQKPESQFTLKGEIIPEVEKVIASEGFKEDIVNSKLLEIIAVVDSLEKNSIALTDVEVDVLLRNAQLEIFNDKRFHQSDTINAISLLSEVEFELDQSFRDKVFENLKTGFQKVRTAVANRNN